MAIIQKREKVTLAPLQVKIDSRLIQKLDRYCEYTNLNRSDIIAQSLAYVMENDKQFREDAEVFRSVEPKRGRKPKTVIAAA